MKTFAGSVTIFLTWFLLIQGSVSCKKIDAYSQKPEIASLQQGLKTCTAIGYCVSIADAAYSGNPLPDNVVFNKNTGFIYVKIDQTHPLPFNKNVGDIIMVGTSSNNGGILSILLANIDVINANVKLYGLHTIPFIKREKEIITVFADQDIIIGNGSDTIMDLSNITNLVFNYEMSRLDEDKQSDPFAIVKQNAWFINIDQLGTTSNIGDDIIVINGGGQIVEARSESGGIIYHALIDAKVDFSSCMLNPVRGTAFTQNIKAGTSFIDLGNSFISFHGGCDGKALVDFSTGKYIGYSGKQIQLNLE